MKNGKLQDKHPKAVSTSLSGIGSLPSVKNHFSRIESIRSIYTNVYILNSHCFLSLIVLLVLLRYIDNHEEHNIT